MFVGCGGVNSNRKSIVRAGLPRYALIIGSILIMGAASPQQPSQVGDKGAAHVCGSAPREPSGPFGLSADWWVAIFTGVLTVATIGLWLETRRSIEHARLATERELRAYISVETFKIGAFHEPGKFGIILKIINTGKTPAYELVFQSNSIRDSLDGKFIPKVSHSGDGSKTTVGAGRELYGTEECDGLSKDEVLSLINKQNTLFLYGSVMYKDAFGKNRETTFRFFLSEVQKDSFALLMHADGNVST